MSHVIETPRLILRRFVPDDVEAFFRLCSEPEIIRYAQNTPVASIDEALALMQAAPLRDYAVRGYGRFACIWRETGDVIGFSGIKHLAELGEDELGYRFLPEFWGRGLATEAGAASIEFARTSLGLSRLVAMVHPDNLGSIRVVSRLGFLVERALDHPDFPDVRMNLFARRI